MYCIQHCPFALTPTFRQLLDTFVGTPFSRFLRLRRAGRTLIVRAFAAPRPTPSHKGDSHVSR